MPPYAFCAAQQQPRSERWQRRVKSLLRERWRREVRDWRRQPVPAPSPSAERSHRAERSPRSLPASNREQPLQERSWWSSRLKEQRRARPPPRSLARPAPMAPERAAALPLPQGRERLRQQAPRAVRERARSRPRARQEPVPKAAARSVRLPSTPTLQVRRLRQSPARPAPMAPERARLRRQAPRAALLRPQARLLVAPASYPTRAQPERPALHRSR